MERRLLVFIFALLAGSAAALLIFAALWREFAFKYAFQFISSFGLLLVAFYYFLRAQVPRNVSKGFLFLFLSPVFFYLGELLFTPILGHSDTGLPRLSDLPWLGLGYLGTPLTRLGGRFHVWHVLVGFMLFGNALALARRPLARVFLAVNLIALLASFVAFVLFV